MPYGVGMIELPEGLRITSVLEESDPDKLRVGMEMKLVITKFFEKDGGHAVLSYKFKPAEATSPVEDTTRGEIGGSLP